MHLDDGPTNDLGAENAKNFRRFAPSQWTFSDNVTTIFQKILKPPKAASAEVVPSPAIYNSEQNNNSHGSADSESGRPDDEEVVIRIICQGRTIKHIIRHHGTLNGIMAKARSITGLIKKYLMEAGMQLHKILHFTKGCQSASVMQRRQNGVTALLRSKYGVDHLTHLHCVEHCEAMTIKDVKNISDIIVPCKISNREIKYYSELKRLSEN
uniref:Uncharacterized protein n=1 Tax=Romanomermis culicivorax TaxID=13658 RepID=A0A915KBZ0_ROMCU